MQRSRVRRTALTTTTPTGNAIVLYIYRSDKTPNDEPPVIITATGERVEWRAPGVYFLPALDLILTTDDPTAA